MENKKPPNPFSKEKIILMCAATLLGVLVTFSGKPDDNAKRYLYNSTIGDGGSQETEEDDDDLSQEQEQNTNTQEGTQQTEQERNRNKKASPYTGEAGPGMIFTDIPSTHPDAAALQFLKDNGIMKGYPDGSFRPDKPVNRAEVIKIIVVALGEPKDIGKHKGCFKDVNSEWFAPYGCYAKWKGWVKGYADGGYHPSNDVNRAELLKMVVEAYGLTPETAPPEGSAFASLDPDAWYAKYVWTAEAAGLMTAWEAAGPDNLNSPATRLEVATAIYTLELGQEETI